MYQKSIILLLTLLASVFLTACTSSKSENNTVNQPVKEPVNTVIQNMNVEILSVESEIDGNTLELKNDAGEVFTGVISIPNLGPDSNFDFDALKVGNNITISGERWQMDSKPQITIREAFENSQVACEARGGKYEASGKAQILACNEKSEEAGKTCTNSDQCDGLCLDQKDGTGKCSEYQTNFGCTDILQDGNSVTICID